MSHKGQVSKYSTKWRLPSKQWSHNYSPKCVHYSEVPLHKLLLIFPAFEVDPGANQQEIRVFIGEDVRLHCIVKEPHVISWGITSRMYNSFNSLAIHFARSIWRKRGFTERKTSPQESYLTIQAIAKNNRSEIVCRAQPNQYSNVAILGIRIRILILGMSVWL